MTCLKKNSSGKKAAALFLIFVAAASGSMFAHHWEGYAQRMPGRIQSNPNAAPAELPSAETIEAYHAAVLEHRTGLLQAKVAAGMITQARADAEIAMIKAHQSECSGECIANCPRDERRSDFSAGRRYGRHF